MKHHRRRILAATLISLVLTAGSVPATSAADQPTMRSTPPYSGKLTDGPAERAALRSLAQFETGDITAAVVTHTVTTRVAGDDEWRASYGTPDWQDEAELRVETADDKLFANWGIDFVVNEYVNWDTNDAQRDLCGLIWPEFNSEIGLNGRDVAVGFLKNPATGAAGCTAANKVIARYQSSTVDWKLTRHEFSHLYGLDDVHSAMHPDDIMEDPYGYPNTWCGNATWHHFQTMGLNADNYD